MQCNKLAMHWVQVVDWVEQLEDLLVLLVQQQQVQLWM